MKISLRVKAAAIIVLMAVLLSLAAIIASSGYIRNLTENSNKNRAKGVSASVASMIDPVMAGDLKDEVFAVYESTEKHMTHHERGTPEFEEYYSHYEPVTRTEPYKSVFGVVRKIQSANDVERLYLVALDEENACTVCLLDASVNAPCHPGCVDSLSMDDMALLDNPDVGFGPYITDESKDGGLVIAGSPVYDENGTVVCYAMVDISMAQLRSQQHRFTRIVIYVLAGITAVICVIGILIVNFLVVRPINRLSAAAQNFGEGNYDPGEIDRINIRTHDEIRALSVSMKKMVNDTRGYIDSLTSTEEALTEANLKATKMDELAHKDAMTGVRSKLAYNQQTVLLGEEIAKGSARFGVVMIDLNDLKSLNDRFGHEKGDAAIKNLSNLICEVYAHSPVYRIGGDEFVVILKGRDYDNAAALAESFNERMDGLSGQPWESVRAALGWAVLESEDSFDDVFRKADHAMYDRKREMKAAR